MTESLSAPLTEKLSPRTLWSAGFIMGVAALLVTTVGFLLLSLFDGYWRTGTYGYLVLPGLIASCVVVPDFVRIFWAHVVRGSPVIGYCGGRFFYMQEGRKSVESAAIRSVEVRKQGLFSFLHFVGSDGQDLQKYPLVLSSLDGSTVAERASVLIRNADAA